MVQKEKAKVEPATASKVRKPFRIPDLYPAISGVQPLAYLGGYLAVLVVFALIYCGLPGQNFYAPYARMEPAAVKDQKAVADNITASLAKSWAAHQSEANGWYIAPNTYAVDDMHVDDEGQLSFRLTFWATRTVNGQETAQTSSFEEFTIAKERIFYVQQTGHFCHLANFKGSALVNPDLSANIHLMLRAPDDIVAPNVICWDSWGDYTLYRLINGWGGDPRMLSGFLPRMFYFSATTITTTGFGDIVPLTGAARLCAGLEAVLGWVLAGLFLNAAATRAANKRTKISDPGA